MLLPAADAGAYGGTLNNCLLRENLAEPVPVIGIDPMAMRLLLWHFALKGRVWLFR